MYRAGIAQSMQGLGYRLNGRGVGVSTVSRRSVVSIYSTTHWDGEDSLGRKAAASSNVEFSIVWHSIIASSWRGAFIKHRNNYTLKHSLIEIGPESGRWMELAHYNV